MTRGQKDLQAWAYALASRTINQVKVADGADMRATVLRASLDELHPGMGEAVRQGVVIYRRHGYSYPEALQHALAEQLLKVGAGKIAQTSETGLGTIDEDIAAQRAADAALMDRMSAADARAEERADARAAENARADRATRVMGGISSLLGSIVEGVTSITTQVRESRDARANRAFEQEQWRTQQIEREREAERAVSRMAREEEQRALDREADERAAARDRESGLRMRDERGGGLGTILLVGGGVAVVSGLGYWAYKTYKSDE